MPGQPDQRQRQNGKKRGKRGQDANLEKERWGGNTGSKASKKKRGEGEVTRKVGLSRMTRGGDGKSAKR